MVRGGSIEELGPGSVGVVGVGSGVGLSCDFEGLDFRFLGRSADDATGGMEDWLDTVFIADLV